MPLYRSEEDKVVAGVCGGLAEYLGVNSTIIRAVTVLLILTPFLVIPLYLAGWFFLPAKSKVDEK
jgi:phage shock protein C